METEKLVWSRHVKDFVLNGLFRLKKVVFKDKETEYNSQLYKRIKTHFKENLPGNEEIDFDRIESNRRNGKVVQDWWGSRGKVILHQKLMEKKSNSLHQIKLAMKGKLRLFRGWFHFATWVWCFLIFHFIENDIFCSVYSMVHKIKVGK